MIAMTDNPVDLLFAAALTVPLLVVAVCYLAIWAEERSGSASTTSGGRTTRPSGVADGLPESEAYDREGFSMPRGTDAPSHEGRRYPPASSGSPHP